MEGQATVCRRVQADRAVADAPLREEETPGWHEYPASPLPPASRTRVVSVPVPRIKTKTERRDREGYAHSRSSRAQDRAVQRRAVYAIKLKQRTPWQQSPSHSVC